jgi:aryl-alcohol dehydrogenase-like predicted oxidoreductase
VTVAELRGWAAISAVQLEYSLVERTVERELLPMAQAYELGTVGWSALGGGLLTGKYRQGETGRKQGLGVVIHDESDARKTATVDAVLAVAKELNVSPGQVAIAWVLHKGVLPILGPRTPAQLADNLGALEVRLQPQQIARLEAASEVALGFPHDLLNETRTRSRLAGDKADRLDYPARPVR